MAHLLQTCFPQYTCATTLYTFRHTTLSIWCRISAHSSLCLFIAHKWHTSSMRRRCDYIRSSCMKTWFTHSKQHWPWIYTAIIIWVLFWRIFHFRFGNYQRKICTLDMKRYLIVNAIQHYEKEWKFILIMMNLDQNSDKCQHFGIYRCWHSLNMHFTGANIQNSSNR